MMLYPQKIFQMMQLAPGQDVSVCEDPSCATFLIAAPVTANAND
ncbi:hypothetical protein DOY81_008697 [Sarcophaga bullata]|nr:hypothetical protein DOY81_008697 [Sarcophaga bullata]